jgi:LPXTG-motif cell wall-anchored protein
VRRSLVLAALVLTVLAVAVPARAADGALPRTGGSAPAMVSLGLGLIALGAVVRRAGRRPTGRARGGAHLAARGARGRHERT